MRIVYLKIPKKLHKFCKTKNCLNEIVLYYQLKILNSNGYFSGTRLVSTMLKKGICKTESSCYYKLRKCIKLGVIEKTDFGYQIVSYDKMFEILGYTVLFNFKKKRKGFFKIHKIKESNIHRVRRWIEYTDLRDSLKQQRILLFKSVTNDKSHPVSLNHYTESSCRERLDQFVSRDDVQNYDNYREDLNGFVYSLLSGNSYEMGLNLDITLSLKGICRILGYTNVSSARKVLKDLVEAKFLSVKKRLVRTEYVSDNIYYKFIDGERYANLSNKINYLV